VADVLIWLSQYGGWGLLAIVVILIFVFYDKLQRPISKLYDLLSWAGASWRRRAVKADIQSNINSFSQSMDKEVSNIMPYNMKLQFVSGMNRAELLREKNLVLVRIRDRRHDDKNFVHAMLTFCPVGVLPASRPYLDDLLSDAIDFTVTRKFLNAIQYQGALNYLYKEVIEPEAVGKPELDKICTILDRLDEQGLFTKVILRELKDFGARIGFRFPEATHTKEASQFIEYMDVIAKRAPGEECDTHFQGNYISMGFVWVGKSDKIAYEGAIPYIKAIQWKKNIGIERIYIAARDAFIDTAMRAAYLAKKRRIARMLKPKEYYAIDTEGRRRKCILIEME